MNESSILQHVAGRVFEKVNIKAEYIGGQRAPEVLMWSGDKRTIKLGIVDNRFMINNGAITAALFDDGHHLANYLASGEVVAGAVADEILKQLRD